MLKLLARLSLGARLGGEREREREREREGGGGAWWGGGLHRFFEDFCFDKSPRNVEVPVMWMIFKISVNVSILRCITCQSAYGQLPLKTE